MQEAHRDTGEREDRRSRRLLAFAGAILAVVLVVATPHGLSKVRRTSEMLATGAGSGHQSLIQLWDEDAMGSDVDAEINAVKKAFMHEQLAVHTNHFRLLTSSLKDNSSADGNDNDTATGNETAASGAQTIAFDNAWFAKW